MRNDKPHMGIHGERKTAASSLHTHPMGAVTVNKRDGVTIAFLENKHKASVVGYVRFPVKEWNEIVDKVATMLSASVMDRKIIPEIVTHAGRGGGGISYPCPDCGAREWEGCNMKHFVSQLPELLGNRYEELKKGQTVNEIFISKAGFEVCNKYPACGCGFKCGDRGKVK